MIKLLKGDCLVESDKIESGSVDLIITDLPYGTVTNIAENDKIKHGMKGKTAWDNVVDTNRIMEIANRILRKNGKMILFAQQPFTTELISKALPNVPFNYSVIWEKDHFANSLIAKKAMVNYYEDILVFSKMNPKNDNTGLNPARDYLRNERDKLKEAGYTDKELRIICNVSLKGGGLLGHYWGKGQWVFPTEKHYLKLQSTGFFKKPYKELEEIAIPYRLNINKELNEKYPFTFNLWEGNKVKSNILKYKKDYDGFHPTQKPVFLLEDLIKTYSNENDLVVDLTMGSGSTGVACKNTNRNFIGIEMNDNYFDIANQRICGTIARVDGEKNERKTMEQLTFFEK